MSISTAETILSPLAQQNDHIRSQFPIFAHNHNGKPLIYFDNAASSQKPQAVLHELYQFYATQYANIHRGLYTLSAQATERYENARQNLASFLGVANANQIVFTKGATESLNLIAQSYGGQVVGEGDEILITDMEHHANLVPWQQLALHKKAVLKYLPLSRLNSIAEAHEDWLKGFFSERTKILAFSGMSNALGTLLPLETLGRIAHDNGTTVVLDAAQLASHSPLHLDDWPVDFAAIAGHKMLGPNGVGLLYGAEALLEQMPPYQMGGDMIRKVDKFTSEWDTPPGKFEAGTPPIAEAIALSRAADFLRQIGLENILHHEKALLQYSLNQLKDFPGIISYGEPNAQRRGGVFSFNLKGVHAFDVATLLAEENIAMRAGHHCCQVLMQELQIDATCRISFYLYNNFSEIDTFIQALHKAQKILSR